MMRKKLGILGGMGPEATGVFYKKIIDHTEVKSDREHLDILIYSHASIPDRTQCILNGQTDMLWEVIRDDIHMFQTAGCEYLAVPCNTCHFWAEQIEKEMGEGFISMIEETAKEAASRGFSKVGIMATDGTVKSGLYEKALAKYGITTVYPSAEKQKDVMMLIYEQIKAGEKGDYSLFSGVVEELREKGCECAIPACTELSVFLQNYQIKDDFYMDALDVLARICIEKCGGIYRG